MRAKKIGHGGTYPNTERERERERESKEREWRRMANGAGAPVISSTAKRSKAAQLQQAPGNKASSTAKTR